ncbi:hypothetical protein C6341_g9679 [Phytophthora cactorum]|nr:hypothetical protein C6341_g9679 [Phytophthora cactorum]
MYSHIYDFETLRRRFHNQFMCQTPLQMIERLKNAKREKGMTAEFWVDFVSSFVTRLQLRIRRSGISISSLVFETKSRRRRWRRRWRTLFHRLSCYFCTNTHIPVEEGSEFADGVKAKPGSESNNIMMQQMMAMIAQTQNLLVQQRKQQMGQHFRPPWNRGPRPDYTATAYENPTPHFSVVTENSTTTTGAGRRMCPDKHTQDGKTVCGRCSLLGCSREQNSGGNSRYQPNASGYNGQCQGGNDYLQTGDFFCDQHDRRIAGYPVQSAMIRMADQNAAGTAPVAAQR